MVEAAQVTRAEAEAALKLCEAAARREPYSREIFNDTARTALPAALKMLDKRAPYGPCEHCGGLTDNEGECSSCGDFGGTDKRISV